MIIQIQQRQMSINSDGVHTVPEGEDETETVDGIEVIKNPKEGVQ